MPWSEKGWISITIIVGTVLQVVDDSVLSLYLLTIAHKWFYVAS